MGNVGDGHRGAGGTQGDDDVPRPEAEAERRAHVSGELRRLRVDHLALRTDEDWLKQMGRHMR